MTAAAQLALDLWGLTDRTEEQTDYRAAWMARPLAVTL